MNNHLLFTQMIWNLCQREPNNVEARAALGKAVSKVAKEQWTGEARRLVWYRSACVWLLNAEW